ncbi:Methylglutaconyl-CoA hydratase [hydrothermal vent metagenome]|uniref:Methylglutaconyl-CoA hydratase n=1 Tax=hydrothermal vent metagenome TaxID=652676 RepID=A0A3B0Y931_9ZZZZ
MNQIICDHKDKIYSVTLNRADCSNAFNEQMVTDLHVIFERISQDKNARLLVISGAGDVFCAGADLNAMAGYADLTTEENFNSALQLALLLDKLNQLPVTTIAKVNGPAMGGGVGLLCCCDIVIAAHSAVFSLSELRLGLLPATILPYVINATGVRQARYMALSGKVFNVERALQLGLVHESVEAYHLDAEVEQCIGKLLRTAPEASVKCKQLLLASQRLTEQDIEQSARLLADIRQTPEAQAGIMAFLNHTTPPWCH